MKKFIDNFINSINVVSIIARYEPLYLLVIIPQIILDAILPILYVYFPKIIIQELMNKSEYNIILDVIITYGIVLIIIKVVINYLNSYSMLLTERFSKQLKFSIGKLAMEIELKEIESGKSSDIIRLASNTTKLTETMGLIRKIISNVITISGLAYIIMKLDWSFILLVCGVLAIKTWFVRLQFNYFKERRNMYAQNDRVGNYLTEICFFNNGAAKELRLNNIQKWFMGKIKGYREEMVGLQKHDYSRYLLFEIITTIILAIQNLLILWILSRRYMSGSISIAEFTMYFSAITTITSCLTSITEQIGEYRRQIVNVTDYKKLIKIRNTENTVKDNSKRFDNEIEKVELVFKNVSFIYPNTDTKVLENINITIKEKEKLVIVGPNGAGKSTFIKLLCKFYRPTTGVILFNGVDIWDIPNEQYYKVIATVFQDFENLSFSIKENIMMKGQGDETIAKNIIVSLGMDKYIESLPKRYGTFINKTFDSDGIELSGGQAQKVAIARSIYKATPLIILDEPTANLDPKAESEIYNDFLRLTDNKTAIFISHRLAVSTIADNIAVFCDGKIVEYGSHEDLMNYNEVYAKMYTKQSKPYLETVS